MKHAFDLLLENISKVHSSIEDRTDLRELRINSLKNLTQPITKIAFDTRRINQETEYNPRSNLQFYHRSEPYITKNSAEALKLFFKLKMAVDSLKEEFFGDPDWHSSYCRILSAALDRILRVEQKDMDFSKPQMDYLNEMLYLRYRINENDLIKLNENELKGIIINKDEKLLHKQIYSQYNNKSNIIKDSNDSLINKLLGEVKASKENKEVQRSLTITINDKVVN